MGSYSNISTLTYVFLTEDPSPFLSMLINIQFLHRKQVEESQKDADRDGVVVPVTMAEYCIKTRLPSKESHASADLNDLNDFLMDDGMDDDFYDEYDDDDDGDEDYGDDDSGAHDDV